MKCPKCAYLGFETSERCRNCGYDFSLSVPPESPDELPLHNADGPGAPLADFVLSDRATASPGGAGTDLDLDRLIGVEEPPAVAPARSATAASRLPLFSPTAEDVDDAPIGVPRPAGQPLSVRRPTPEVPRGRTRAARVVPRNEQPPMPLGLEPELRAESTVDAPRQQETARPEPLARAASRLIAALIDLVLLAAIDFGVLYLTLAIAGLAIEQALLIPAIPLGAFFLLMNGGYLIVFTAASGQTIGKMLTGIRVVSDDGNRVDASAAVLRAAGCAASLLTLGLGYLPAFVSAERRALQDRIAGTRVVSVS